MSTGDDVDLPAPIRLVCLGDSFTEGMCDDLRPDGEYLGWADRVADALARQVPGRTVEYANLAVRGKLLDQVVDDQVDRAVALAPTVITFHAGLNDALRPGVDLAALGHRYDAAVRRLTGIGCRVLIFTWAPRAPGPGRLARTVVERIERFNVVARAVAARYGTGLVDLRSTEVFADHRLWHVDRLHFGSAGHVRVAAAVLEQLGVTDPTLLGGPVGWWRAPLPPPPAARRRRTLADDLRWTRVHFVPWIVRRLRGVSSGDGRHPKDAAPRVVLPGGPGGP
jgi:lysophospholipase L1-like esterase